MSEQHRTKKEYIEAHANQYCHGDKEEAKEQKIVKEVCKTLKGETNEEEGNRSAD